MAELGMARLERNGELREGKLRFHLNSIFLGGVKVPGLSLKKDQVKEPEIIGVDPEAKDSVRIFVKDGSMDFVFAGQNRVEHAAAFMKLCSGFLNGSMKAGTIGQNPYMTREPYSAQSKKVPSSVAATARTPSPRKLQKVESDDFSFFGQMNNMMGKAISHPRMESTVEMQELEDGISQKRALIDANSTTIKHSPPSKRRYVPPKKYARNVGNSLVTLEYSNSRVPTYSAAYQSYRSSENFGLRNLGNTCYLNAVMQAQMSLIEFVKELKGLPETLGNSRVHGGVYSCTVDIFEQMERPSVARGPPSPAKLRERIAASAPMFASNAQQDAHEFLLEYLNQLHDELLEARSAWLRDEQGFQGGINVDENALHDVVPLPTQQHFHSEVRKRLECVQCSRSREVHELFRDFSLDFSEASSGNKCDLERMIQSYFGEELLDARCEHCGAAAARMEKKMISAPRTLVLHLKRYVPNHFKRCYEKKHQDVMFPICFDLAECLSGKSACRDVAGNPDAVDVVARSSAQPRLPARPLAADGRNSDSDGDLQPISIHTSEPFMKGASEATRAWEADEEAQLQEAMRRSLEEELPDVDKAAPLEYTLRAVIAHDGISPHSGHYVCYAQNAKGVWRLYNDSVAKDLDSTFNPSAALRGKAYILFYVLKAPALLP